MNTNSVSHPAPILYRPTSAEILHVTESAKHRHGALASRISKAADILISGSLALEPVAWEVRQMVHWRIESQSHDGAYIVPGMHCPCQDSRAPMVNLIRFCKHAIAIASYFKILRNHLNDDIKCFNVELGILSNKEFHGYAKGAGYMHIRKVCEGAYTFADSASAVRYAIWLATQQPVAVEWPVTVDVAVPSTAQ